MSNRQSILTLAVLLWCAHASAQNLVPNNSFEQGTNAPTGWSLVGNGSWTNVSHSGAKSIFLANSSCGNSWSTLQCPLEPSRLYLVKGRLKANSPFCETAGELRIDVGQYRKAVRPEDYWRQHVFVAITPSNMSSPLVKLEQCNVIGGLFADDLEIRPALALPQESDSLLLGAGEKIGAGTYAYESALDGPDCGYARPLYVHTAYFDSWRWSIKSNQFITYKHELNGRWFTNATHSFTTYWADKGKLVSEVSIDGQNWIETGSITVAAPIYGPPLLRGSIPPALLPCTNFFVRVRCLSGNFLVKGYSLTAGVPENQSSTKGKTSYFELEQPSVAAAPYAMIERPQGWTAVLRLHNPNIADRLLSLTAVVQGTFGFRTNALQVTVPPLTSRRVELDLPSAGAGDNVARIEVADVNTGAIQCQGSVSFNVEVVNETYVGHRLASPDGVLLSWCENTHKVSRTGWDAPDTAEAVEIFAARNEYEPFQLVLRPTQPLTNARASMSAMVLQQPLEGFTISASNSEICLVEYVPVTQILDPIGAPGDYPDPLVPATNSFFVPAGTNQPLWVTVYVPKDAPAGIYEGTLTITSDNLAPVVAPIRLRVHDFSLSDATHTKTGYQLWLDSTWYKFNNENQRQYVWDLYMENFRRHRISPMVPQLYSDLKPRAVGNDVALDTRDFDRVMTRYLDEFGFNSFAVLKPPPATLGGFERYTPGYQALLGKLLTATMAHLQKQGWDKKAYLFWYDEPFITGQYSKCVEEMSIAKAAVPDLPRLSTTHPDDRLYGSINLWAPMLHLYSWNFCKLNTRFQLGEQAWWYVACAPKHPYPNNFIDHAAINQRIRPWLAEKYKSTGDLYWCTMWYKGTDGVDRNPWEDPMSGSNWGNGDGMLLYPPVRSYPTGPVLSGPINSLRWEIIRESMEDGEYFWLLKQALSRALPNLGQSHPSVIEAQAALAAIAKQARALDDFEESPRALQSLRLRLASAIEALDDGSPFIVTHPVSKTIEQGSSVDFRVEALGWPLPSYQWYRNNSSIAGATQSVLSLVNPSLQEPGSFYAVISSASGAVTSQVAVLHIVLPQAPQIVLQPSSVARRLGEGVVLTAGVLGSSPLSYSWTFNGTPVAWGTSETLRFASLASYHFGAYQVTITNAVGAATSQVAVISRAPDPPAIIAEAPDVQKFVGESATLQVAVAGTEPMSYRWTFEGNPVQNANTNALVIPNVSVSDFGVYRVIVTNIVGGITGAPAWIHPATIPLIKRFTTSSGAPQLSVLTRFPTSIQVSSNLIDWEVFTTLPPGNTVQIVSDPAASNSPTRFYRIRAD